MNIENFNAETSIKKWAIIIRTLGYTLMMLCTIAAFIVLAIDAQNLWWISLNILGVSGLTTLVSTFTSSLIWGFGDIVGNVKKIANGSQENEG